MDYLAGCLPEGDEVVRHARQILCLLSVRSRFSTPLVVKQVHPVPVEPSSYRRRSQRRAGDVPTRTFDRLTSLSIYLCMATAVRGLLTECG